MKAVVLGPPAQRSHGRPLLVLDMYEYAYHMDYGAAAAMTCGTATPSSIVCTASDFDLRLRRAAMGFLVI